MSPKEPFEHVVTRYAGTVLAVCRVLLGPADAEDAWSETFMAALRAYPKLPETANLEAWLVTIAHRKAIDVVRGATRRPTLAAELPETPARSGLPEAADPELWRCVRGLPDRQRQVIAYHYLAGLPYAEIALIVGGTAEAARRAASDGLRNLRRSYAGATDKGAS